MVLLLWGVLYVVGLGALDVQGSLEGIRIVVARTMVETGEWIVPSFAGETYLLKPPLVNWQIAASGALLGGVSTFAARLPSALAVLATALVLLAWARRRGAERAGTAAAILYLLLPLVFEKGIRAEIESSLALFAAASLLAFHEATRGLRGEAGPPAAAAWTTLAGVCFALAVLAKGPPFLLVAVATLVPWLTWRGWRVLSLPGIVGGLLVGSLVLAAWVVPLVAAVGWEDLRRTFEVEVLQRARAADPGNREGLFYYLPSLLGGALPAFLLLPWLYRSKVAARYASSLLFLAFWVLGPLLLFSLVSGKESRYLLPLYPALALLAGFGFEALLEKRPRLEGRMPRLAVGLLLLAIGVKAVWLLAVVPHKNERKSPRPLAEAVAERVAHDVPLTFLGKPRAQFLYYLHRPVVHVEDVEAWRHATPEGPGHALLAPLEHLDGDELARIRGALHGATAHDLRWGPHPYRLWVRVAR